MDNMTFVIVLGVTIISALALLLVVGGYIAHKESLKFHIKNGEFVVTHIDSKGKTVIDQNKIPKKK